jgi:ABC-type hemin transport system ATPase subunit
VLTRRPFVGAAVAVRAAPRPAAAQRRAIVDGAGRRVEVPGAVHRVLSTHDPDRAFLCADLVALLHEGRLARRGPAADVITTATLRDTYGVEVEVVTIVREGHTTRVCLPTVGRD